MTETHRREEDEATRTPVWLPILGIALFLLIVTYALASARSGADATVELAPEIAVDDEPSDAPEPSDRPARPADSRRLKAPRNLKDRLADPTGKHPPHSGKHPSHSAKLPPRGGTQPRP